MIEVQTPRNTARYPGSTGTGADNAHWKTVREAQLEEPEKEICELGGGAERKLREIEELVGEVPF